MIEKSSWRKHLGGIWKINQKSNILSFFGPVILVWPGWWPFDQDESSWFEAIILDSLPSLAFGYPFGPLWRHLGSKPGEKTRASSHGDRKLSPKDIKESQRSPPTPPQKAKVSLQNRLQMVTWWRHVKPRWPPDFYHTNLCFFIPCFTIIWEAFRIMFSARVTQLYHFCATFIKSTTMFRDPPPCFSVCVASWTPAGLWV